MTKLERLKIERDRAKEQVERFERKYKNFNTVWHSILTRVNKEIAKLEARKKPPKKKIVEKENNDG